MRSWWAGGLGLVVLCAVVMTGPAALSGPDAAAPAAAPGKAKTKRRAPAGGGDELACKAASDCVLVTDGCCGCNEGGKQRAIPARAREAYEKKRKALCRSTMCPALMSEDPSCLSGQAVCKEGKCALGS
jgi:hypothetical protein